MDLSKIFGKKPEKRPEDMDDREFAAYHKKTKDHAINTANEEGFGRATRADYMKADADYQRAEEMRVQRGQRKKDPLAK